MLPVSYKACLFQTAGHEYAHSSNVLGQAMACPGSAVLNLSFSSAVGDLERNSLDGMTSEEY